MITLTKPPQIPEQYIEPIRFAIRAVYNRAHWTLTHHYGFTPHTGEMPILDNDALLLTPVADTLAEIARAAAGQREHDGVLDGELAEAIQEIAEMLFANPLTGSYAIPETFWTTDLGAMIARARIWLRDDLITIAEAAELADVSLPAITQAANTGRLTIWVDPDAPAHQGRRLVSLSEIKKRYPGPFGG
jgi:hypothetical protein